MEKEKYYWLAFSAFEGIGPKRFALLKNYYGSAARAWKAGKSDYLEIGLGPKLTDELVQFKKSFDPYSYYLRLRENKIVTLFLGDKFYPKNLATIDSPPFVLYVLGEILPADEMALAVVGTRLMTGYGGQVTGSLVTELTVAGLTIVSGLARGVDTAAHQAALKAGGRTIAVLACGLNECYPPENIYLMKKIAGGQGAVISEFPLGMRPVPSNFPARNRIIAGLSLGTVVIEGARKSGSLITARHAVEQGREVFAVPGPITSRFSVGPAHLIKLGAKLVINTQDILEELKIEEKSGFQQAKEVLPETKDEELVMSLIRDEAKHLDEIARAADLDIGMVTALLSMMEIKGKVRNLGGQVFIINS